MTSRPCQVDNPQSFRVIDGEDDAIRARANAPRSAARQLSDPERSRVLTQRGMTLETLSYSRGDSPSRDCWAARLGLISYATPALPPPGWHSSPRPAPPRPRQIHLWCFSLESGASPVV
jgi:hypothetical protein